MPAMPQLLRTSHLPQAPETVYAWHARPGALQRLTPPWQHVRMLDLQGDFETRRSVLRVGRPPLSITWVAQHQDAVPGRRFVDVQVDGPFAQWRHTHQFEPAPEGGCTLTDQVDYRLPLGPLRALGPLRRLAERIADRHLQTLFDFRHQRTAEDLARHAAFADQPRLRVAISGARGLVGQALAAYLSTAGHDVRRLVRGGRGRPDEIRWNPEKDEIDRQALEGIDAVVHLAGEPLSAGRWSAQRKERILASREKGTRLLAEAIAGMDRKPQVLVSASAVGLYGDRGDEVVDANSPPGQGFLADVCCRWEAAADPARQAGVRVCHPRLGVVMAGQGGMLAEILPLFRKGLGGRIGSGQQWLSWIGLDDLLAVLELALHEPRLHGPFDAVAPHPVRQGELAATLARVLRRPAWLPVPVSALRLLFGQMADEALLASTRVRPTRLESLGFTFCHADLPRLLARETGRA